MMKNLNKSSYYCLLCMEYILNNNVFKPENILSYLEENYGIFIFKETVLKYIRTLKNAGFKFQRINNSTYRLIKLPFTINLTKAEEDILSEHLKYFSVHNIINSDKIKTFDKINLIISKSISDKKTRFLADEHIFELNKYCEDKLNIKFSYNQNSLLAEPYELIFINHQWYLKCYDLTNKEPRLLLINNISNIKQTPIKNKFVFTPQQVTLRLLPDLARSYTLKEDEELIKQDESGMYITRLCEDKIMFFKNILRYMDKCEIIYPSPLKEDFLKYVGKILEKYLP